MTNKKSLRFAIYVYIELVAAILFSFFSLGFSGDISLLAFPIALIFTGITVYFGFFKMLKPKDGTKAFCVLKLTQYLPFVLLLSFVLRRAGNNGTYYWYDVVTVILWCVVFIFSLVISYCLHDKRAAAYTKDWTTAIPKKKKLHGGARIVFEIVDWIDALVQAVFMVLLIQIFILQLYVIPSESMVPTFLVKDRVAVTKINCGPKFPLTEVGLKGFTTYKRGDIIVVRNPHYSMDRKSEVKTVTSQLVYMLTLTTVNLNRDENGEPKADPLVKRITGVPGEQLVMQDGVLYSRTKDSDVFEPVKADEKYACWNLGAVSDGIKENVQSYVLSSVRPSYTQQRRTNTQALAASSTENYKIMLDFEEYRRNYDLDMAAIEAKALSDRFAKLCYTENLIGSFDQPSLDVTELLSSVQSLTGKMMNTTDGKIWFDDFVTSWIDKKNSARDIYEEANFRLNVITKMCFAKLAVRYAEMIRGGISAASWTSDSEILSTMETAEKVNWYVENLLDSRNMPVFPENDSNGNPQYIPANCYFMMGDNRFNSLDMRHANDYSKRSLTKDDRLSVTYESIIAPQYVNKKYILGKPNFRFWPVNRRGSVK